MAKIETPKTPDMNMLNQLVELGIEPDQARQALIATNNQTIEEAVAYIYG